MPRTVWESKNPYCRRSKLSKSAFERIAFFYCLEITAGWSRSASAQMLRVGSDGVRLSRQSISSYFDALGTFLFETVVLPAEPRYEDAGALDELHALVHGQKDKTAQSFDIVPAYLKTIPLKVKFEGLPVHRTLLFHLLQRRAKATRGIPKEQFPLEVARAAFVCACVEAQGMDMSRDANFFEYRNAKAIARLAFSVLLDTLERHPLDRGA